MHINRRTFLQSTLAATGGTTPYTWSVSAGSLPAGLTLTAETGVISGTPTTAATSTFTVARTISGKIEITDRPVVFSHVRPGETLLRDTIAAE